MEAGPPLDAVPGPDGWPEEPAAGSPPILAERSTGDDRASRMVDPLPDQRLSGDGAADCDEGVIWAVTKAESAREGVASCGHADFN